ncbi:HAMP domain-containing sensor histidine kinase [Asticcacaulis solisilvae]|uniref:HAMP domain-containing sensor histidine kinase n=1 Tax=Asticcacaulis solisilvae TaxID=1217274 RepID=UPI003FD762E1
MSKTTARPRLISLPIFWQVLGLSLVVLVLALGINTLLVLKAPEPPPSGYSLQEVAAALRTGKVTLHNGKTLTATTEDTLPADFRPSQPPPEWMTRLETMIATRLARELNTPASTISVKLPESHFHGHGYHGRFWGRQGFDDSGPQGGPQNGPQNNPGFQGGPQGGPQMDTANGFGGPGGNPGEAPMGFGNGDGPQTTVVNPAPDGAPQVRNEAVPAPGMPGPMSGPMPSQGHPSGEHGGPPELMHETMRFVSNDGRAELYFPGFSAAWKQKDGTYRIITPPQSLIQPWQTRLLIGFALTALLILPLAWLMSQRLTRPIIAFSDAAAKMSFEHSAPPILAVGSREVRQAADVLNAMQSRIRKQMESRTALMGAIAHDLKTPLARMRLRIEDLPDAIRDKLGDDIAHMDGLVKSAMSFTTAHRLADQLRPLDISALAEAIAEDMAAVCPVEAGGIEHNVMVRGDMVALKRILTNLIENACRYAGHCRVSVATLDGTVTISVADDGPGLPEDMLETVFEPFYRMEESRNRNTGGTGLGLSVARALAEAHGGTLTLANRYARKRIAGLDARLTLPRLVMK